MFRSAVVGLAPNQSNDEVISQAIYLSKQYEVTLTGVTIVDLDDIAPAEVVPIGGSAFKAAHDKVKLEQQRLESERILGSFRERCSEAGVTCDAELAVDGLTNSMSYATQQRDVLLVGHTYDRDGEPDTDRHSKLQAIVQYSPRPVMVVPNARQYASSVLIAYDASLQAARTLQAFVTSGWYAEAEVEVVSFHHEQSTAVERAEIASAFLRRHGRKVNAVPLASSANVAHAMMDMLTRNQYDLLVMGAFGKPFWKEFLFGSVTREVFRRCPVPVFVDH